MTYQPLQSEDNTLKPVSGSERSAVPEIVAFMNDMGGHQRLSFMPLAGAFEVRGLAYADALAAAPVAPEANFKCKDCGWIGYTTQGCPSCVPVAPPLSDEKIDQLIDKHSTRRECLPGGHCHPLNKVSFARDLEHEIHSGNLTTRADSAPMVREAEVRRNDDNTLDEFIAHNADVHLEQMNDGHWWMGVSLSNGSFWHLNFTTKRNAAIGCFAEHEWHTDSGAAAGATKPNEMNPAPDVPDEAIKGKL